MSLLILLGPNNRNVQVTGVSGKLKDILLAKGAPVVTDPEVIKKVLKGKEVKINDDGTYERYLAGEVRTKTLLGNPI